MSVANRYGLNYIILNEQEAINFKELLGFTDKDIQNAKNREDLMIIDSIYLSQKLKYGTKNS